MTSFSIIIPSYNQQEFLPDAIESALEQKPWTPQIVVIDDGSTDHSLELARKYPVTVISQRNKGLASARNTGIMNATGEYILPLDADDILMPNCIEKMLEAAEQTHADIIAPSFKNFGVLNDAVILGGTPTLEDFKVVNRLPYFCAIKRETLLEVGGYSPRMDKGWEDFHMWFDLFTRGKTLCLMKDILVLYRTKENSMITEANKHSVELWAQIIKDFPQVWDTQK